MATALRVKDKVALITGAASGLGKAIAGLLHREGAQVILTDIQDEIGAKVAQNLGHRAFYHSLDVSQEAQWVTLDQWIQRKGLKVTILINNAGITGFSEALGPQDPEHASLESWRSVHAVNADGVFLGCRWAIAHMKGHGGAIVNISSRSAMVGIPGAAAYASSKASVRNHTKSVAIYCAEQDYSIRCNSIHPGAILTPMWESMLPNAKDRKQSIQAIAEQIPLKRMGEPIDVAYAALYLASDEAKYITGTELTIDGGILASSGAPPKNNQ